MNTQFVVAPAVERRVKPQTVIVDPLTKQDEDFARVWMALRHQVEYLGNHQEQLQ